MLPAFDDHDPPARELLDDCVHCGFCLPACPTYRLWGEEADSPRGRILLMDAAARGQLALTPDLVRHWDACLGCMACVPACPSGVRYDRLIEQTRQQVERRHRRPAADRLRRAAIFAVAPHPRRMRAVAAALLVYRASGLRRLLQRRIGGITALAPAISAAAVTARTPHHVPAVAANATIAGAKTAVLLTGCVQHGLYGDVNQATARVLSAYGWDVHVPTGQGCCGALELHAGRQAAAQRRARKLLAAFGAAMDSPGAVLAVNSAGCGSVLKEYAELLAGTPEAAAAEQLAARTRDVSELLAAAGTPSAPLHPLPLRVAYHDACHLAHAQGIRDQPRALLASIPGLEIVPLAEAELCCGSAGIYNLVQPKAAADLGRRKAAHVRSAAPDVLVAANPGCLLQISAHLGGDGGVPTFHPVELLDAALRGVDAQALVSDRRRLQGLG
jgi:glycolate dehydrogenase iron-sulfur subunit